MPTPTPVEFMRRYRNLKVTVAIEDPVDKREGHTMPFPQLHPVDPHAVMKGAQAQARGISIRSSSIPRTRRMDIYSVKLGKYFMMNWKEGTEQRRDYNAVTLGSRDDSWFQANKERIRSAAMGKGAPHDYELALEWAVRSKKISTVTQAALQTYCDEHLGIDCSGFATNYLIACGKRTYSGNTVQNTSAASYYNATAAINDLTQVQTGDLLVWMKGNFVLSSPGHIAVVESYVAQSQVGGNMCVVEATGSPGANPKLLDSMYVVEQIIPKGGNVPVMILMVKRHGVSGSRVAVIRPGLNA